MTTSVTFQNAYMLSSFVVTPGDPPTATYTVSDTMFEDPTRFVDLSTGAAQHSVSSDGISGTAADDANDELVNMVDLDGAYPDSEVPYAGYTITTVSGGVEYTGMVTYSKAQYTPTGPYVYTYWLNTDDPAIAAGTAGSADFTPTYTYPICFLAGTKVATPEGERDIETLAVGDLVTLANGEQKPVKWVGRQTVKLHPFNRATATPVLVRAGALGNGLPRRDVFTTYDHAFALDGVLATAGVLTNGTSIVQCSDWAESTVVFYQLDVGSHELMLVEGAAAETFSGNEGTRERFDNADEFKALYGDVPCPEPMALGRVNARRQLPSAVKARIAAAAGALAKRVA